MFFWDEDAEKINEILTHIRWLHTKKLEETNENPYEKSDEKDIWHKLECLEEKIDESVESIRALLQTIGSDIDDIRKKIDCCHDNGPIVIEKKVRKKSLPKKKD